LSEIKNIINGCLKGYRRDQELLYRRYAAKLYAVCLQYAGNDEEARDILQEGFIKIFENLVHYKHEGSFEGWIRRIIVNTALEKYRSRHNLYRVDDIDDIPNLMQIRIMRIIQGLKQVTFSELSGSCHPNTGWYLISSPLKDIHTRRLAKW